MEGERLKTHVENLDTYLKGGLETGNVYLVEGESGTMKSAICYYMAYQNAVKEGKKSLYITTRSNERNKHNVSCTVPVFGT